MNCNERADNMSKRKLADHFNSGNNTNVREDVDSTVDRISQLSRLLLHKIRKPSR